MDQLTEREAASLALALVAVATASVDGGRDVQAESDRGLVELVDRLSDVPLTERQANVIETIGTASAALTTGLSEVIAVVREWDVDVVLRLTAQAVLAQTPDGDSRAA